MKVIHGIKLKPGSREEELPGYSAEFPHIASFVELDKYAGKQAPWHSFTACKNSFIFNMVSFSFAIRTPFRASSICAPGQYCTAILVITV